MSYIKNLLEKNYKEGEIKELTYSGRMAKKTTERLVEINNLLGLAEEAGELISKEHKDINTLLGKIMEDCYSSEIGTKSMIRHEKDYKKNEIEEFLFYDVPSTVTGLNKFLKTLNKIKKEDNPQELNKVIEETKKITEELVGLRERSVDLKSKIVKKRASVVKKEKEQVEMASHKDVLKAKEYLGEVIEEIKEDVISVNKKRELLYYQNIIEAIRQDGFKKAPSTIHRGQKDNYAQRKYTSSELLKVAIPASEGDHFIVLQDRELDNLAQKSAEKIFDNLKSFYTSRVGEKVAVILNDKNNLKEIETLDISVSSEIETFLRFKFLDESQFDLKTTVEIVNLQSENVDQFLRFPTRFHNVITSDGVSHTNNLSQKLVQDLFKKDIEQKKDITDLLVSNKNKEIRLAKKNKLK